MSSRQEEPGIGERLRVLVSALLAATLAPHLWQQGLSSGALTWIAGETPETWSTQVPAFLRALPKGLASLERGLFGGREPLYLAFGLVLLTFVAWGLQRTVERLAPATRGALFGLPMPTSVVAAVIFLSRPETMAAAGSIAGHAALLVAGVGLILANRWTDRGGVFVLAGLAGLAWLVPESSRFGWVGPTSTPMTDITTGFAPGDGSPMTWSLLLPPILLFLFSLRESGRWRSLGFLVLLVGTSWISGIVPAAVAAVGMTTWVSETRRFPTLHTLALMLVVFLVYTRFNERRLTLRAAAPLKAEQQAILSDIDKLNEEWRDLLVLGVPEDAETAQGLRARVLAPWTPTPRQVLWARDGHWSDDLPLDLFAGGARRLVLVWAPPSLAASLHRPRGWRLEPRVVGRRPPHGEGPLRLVAPETGHRIVVRTPKTLDEDLSFTFEVREERLEGATLLFHGFYDGGWSPRGRRLFERRQLVPSVLEPLPAPEGWRRFRWRTSVRPGPGEDGLPFDDPELGLAGHGFWWCLGIEGPGADRAEVVTGTRHIRFLSPDNH